MSFPRKLSVLLLVEKDASGNWISDYGKNNRGIPGVTNNGGFYRDTTNMNADSRSVADLEKLINDKKACFCKRCIIQIHSCRIGSTFAEMLGKATGCKVYYATGACKPSKDGKKWASVPGKFAERSRYNGFMVTDAGKPSKPHGDPAYPGDPNSTDDDQGSYFTPYGPILRNTAH